MSLAQRSVRSAGYMIASSGFQAAIQFARSIILARWLLPEHYGVYTYAASFVLLTYALPGFGMGAAILHRTWQSDGEIARRVQFTLTLIFNAVWVMVLVICCSWLFEEQNRWVFWVVLLTQAAINLTGVARTKLNRAVAFRRIAVIEGFSTFVGSGIAIYLAWRSAGFWSLVSPNIISAVVSILGFYIIYPVWKPRFGWSRDVAIYLLDFGRRSLGASILQQALNRVDDLWIGTFLGEASLGFYSRAYTFSTYPRKLLANPVNQVTIGTYAALKENPKQLSQAFFRANAFLIRSGFLLAGLFFLLIPEFIHFVIGDKWLPMIAPFRLMLIYTMLDPIKFTIGSLFIALGKPEQVVRTRFWQLIVLGIGLFTLGPWLGISGVVLAMNFMLVFGIVLLLWQVTPYVQYSVKALFGAPLLGLAVGLLLVHSIIYYFNFSNGDLSLSGAIVKSLSFSFVYLLFLFSLERRQWSVMIMTGVELLRERTYSKTGDDDL